MRTRSWYHFRWPPLIPSTDLWPPTLTSTARWAPTSMSRCVQREIDVRPSTRCSALVHMYHVMAQHSTRNCTIWHDHPTSLSDVVYLFGATPLPPSVCLRSEQQRSRVSKNNMVIRKWPQQDLQPRNHHRMLCPGMNAFHSNLPPDHPLASAIGLRGDISVNLATRGKRRAEVTIISCTATAVFPPLPCQTGQLTPYPGVVVISSNRARMVLWIPVLLA